VATQKLFAGTKLREIRSRFELTQKDFAQKLGVSLPYLNQMENSKRPISTTVMLALAEEFSVDVTELTSGDGERLVSDIREALADPILSDDSVPLSDIQLSASNAPSLARAFLKLHQAYRQTHERLASLDEALGRQDALKQASPWDEVRDFFHYCDNYIDAVDHAAERFAHTAQDKGGIHAAAVSALETIGVRISLDSINVLRRYDAQRKVLSLSNLATPETRNFQLLLQVALLQRNSLLEATLDLARFQSDAARQIAKIGLANYFAGAATMPYETFLTAAKNTRHDLEILATQFGASIEQVAHRLSTLQRPDNKGVPFFFVRVDQAGTITKRHSATRLQFARFGGACPLWNVHRAFETPGRFLRQLAETPDGVRYFSLARDVSKSGGHYGAPVRRYAIALGCELKHAHQIVYADNMDVSTAASFEPIGISCRICERPDCHQRSVPPLERKLTIHENERGVVPYEVG